MVGLEGMTVEERGSSDKFSVGLKSPRGKAKL